MKIKKYIILNLFLGLSLNLFANNAFDEIYAKKLNSVKKENLILADDFNSPMNFKPTTTPQGLHTGFIYAMKNGDTKMYLATSKGTPFETVEMEGRKVLKLDDRKGEPLSGYPYFYFNLYGDKMIKDKVLNISFDLKIPTTNKSGIALELKDISNKDAKKTFLNLLLNTKSAVLVCASASEPRKSTSLKSANFVHYDLRVPIDQENAVVSLTITYDKGEKKAEVTLGEKIPRISTLLFQLNTEQDDLYFMDNLIITKTD